MEDGDYTVGWICALSHELAASKAMLDETHNSSSSAVLDDHNIYTRGKIGDHNVVIACLPAGKYGIGSAAVSATHMKRSFPSLDFGFLVGIGGAVPGSKHDIKLGDVVVSKPTQDHGGVIQYDMGKTLPNGSFERRGYMNKPPTKLLNAINNLSAEYDMRGSDIPKYLHEAFEKFPRMREKYSRPQTEVSASNSLSTKPELREDVTPAVHYGLIASGNRVISNTEARNHLIESHDILCFEMEAAGLDDFPCLVIRGISDYADETKNDDWQRYAAITAAAYAKELLLTIRPSSPHWQNFNEHDDSLGTAGRLRAMLVNPDRRTASTMSTISRSSSEAPSAEENKIFRIRNIPNNMDRLDLINLLSRLDKLSLAAEDIEVLSLARAANAYETYRAKVAIVKIRRVPLALQDGRNQWNFCADSRIRSQKDLVLDSHFHGFTTLCDPSQEGDIVDCIAIGGIGCHPHESWTSIYSDYMYLRDQMPTDFPLFRILLYGLETEMALTASIEDIARVLAMDIRVLRPGPLARRPTIFLAHSLGGVVLKYSLVHMANTSDLEDFLRNIMVMMCFGVPSEKPNIADIVAMCKYVPPVGLMDVLSSENELESLQDQFRGATLLRDIQIFSAYELHQSNSAELSTAGDWVPSAKRKILVPKSSAITANPDESSTLPVKHSHHNMTRLDENEISGHVITQMLKSASETFFRTMNRPDLSPYPSHGHGHAKKEINLTFTDADSHVEALHPSLPKYDAIIWSSYAAYQEHLSNLLMKSLRFEDDEQRYKQVSSASTSTFEWAFSPAVCNLSPWLESGTGAFWITGRPGSGKSTFMKFLFEHKTTQRIFEEHSEKQKIVAVQFFFHGRGSSTQRSFEGLMQSIIYQMLNKEPALKQYIEPIFKRRFLSFWQLWNFDELDEALERIFRNELSIRIFLFLDAIDEYSGTKTIICDFIKKHALLSGNVSICFSSRPWNVFKDHFQDLSNIRMHEHTQDDISMFISRSVKTRPSLKRLTDKESGLLVAQDQTLLKLIQTRAKGVFLWVVLVLNVLEQRCIDGITYEASLKVMNELPDELDTFYDQIIAAIPQAYREEAYIIFELVLRSDALIDLDLVHDALMLAGAKSFSECLDKYAQNQYGIGDPNQSTSFSEHYSDLERIISSRCGGLVEYASSTSLEGESSVRQVQFMHHTVFEYFRAFGACQGLIDQALAASLGTGHSIIAKVLFVRMSKATWPPSMNYLNLLHHVRESENTTGLSQRAFLRSIPSANWDLDLKLFFGSAAYLFLKRDFPKLIGLTMFANFAGLHLFLLEESNLYNRSQVMEPNSADDFVSQLFASLPRVLLAAWRRSNTQPSCERVCQFTNALLSSFKIPSPSQALAMCFENCLQALVVAKADLEVNEGRVSQLSHDNMTSTVETLIEILLMHGQDPNQMLTFDTELWTCLTSPSRRNWIQSLTSPRKMNWIQSSTTFVALHLGVTICNDKVVSMLLNYGANPNTKDSIGRTPLDWALELSPKGNYLHRFKLDRNTISNPSAFSVGDPGLEQLFSEEESWTIEDSDDELYYANRANRAMLSRLSRVSKWHFAKVDIDFHPLIVLLETHGATINTLPTNYQRYLPDRSAVDVGGLSEWMAKWDQP